MASLRVRAARVGALTGRETAGKRPRAAPARVRRAREGARGRSRAGRRCRRFGLRRSTLRRLALALGRELRLEGGERAAGRRRGGSLACDGVWRRDGRARAGVHLARRGLRLVLLAPLPGLVVIRVRRVVQRVPDLPDRGSHRSLRLAGFRRHGRKRALQHLRARALDSPTRARGEHFPGINGPHQTPGVVTSCECRLVCRTRVGRERVPCILSLITTTSTTDVAPT